MAVGTDSGLCELDLVATRSTRVKLAAAGGSSESIEDPDTWRPPQAGVGNVSTVHPRDVMDAYYTPSQVSVRIVYRGVPKFWTH